jgi:lipopolysaccharide/colanic/teichoic acid biosynthesis glycosyltransferase
MMFLNLPLALRRLGIGSSSRWMSYLLSVRQFQRLLSRERARSDRSGDRFSLLVFIPSAKTGGSGFHSQLARSLHRRLRSTDEAGWLDRDRIAVVLPGTSPRGAWKLADDVCRNWNGNPKPVCQVYCYPSDTTQLDQSIVDRRAGKNNASDAPATHDNHGKALEPLFMKQMPLWKRSIDIFGAAVGLVLLLPVFAAVAVAIKFSSRGPVVFKQMRSGCGGNPFLMYKFRSMVTDAEARKAALLEMNEQDGPAFKLTRDPRVTRVGQFLRATSLDELPQLWNVLKGEMSLVGPRPLPCNESNACLDWQRRRLDVAPGLTCIWQVRGRSSVNFNEWIRMDLEYVSRRTLWNDTKILLATVPAVIQRRGAK